MSNGMTSFRTRLRQFGQNIAASARLARLRSAIVEMQSTYETRRMRVADDRKPHLADAVALLREAGVAQERKDLSTGWSLFFRAERAAAAADSGDEVAARAVRLRAEVKEKLSGWRQSAALEVLGCPGDETLPGVQTAMDLISERASNVYYQGELRTGQVTVVGLVLVVLLVLVLLYAPRIDGAGGARWAALLGAFGGALSAVRSVMTGGSGGKRIPEQIFSWRVTILRPVVGAAAGTATFLLLKAGIVTVGAPTGAGTDLAPLAASMLAGLSERYFLSLIQSGEKS